MRNSIILFTTITLSACGTDNSGYEVFNDVQHLKPRMIASVISEDKSSVSFTLEQLKIKIQEDDQKLKDFRERGLISALNSLSSFSYFYSSQRLISDNKVHWVDYSQQTLINGIYSVPVSESVCDYMNDGVMKKNKLCAKGIYSFNLIKQTIRAYKYKLVLKIPDNFTEE